jgi:hypothetical protein
MVGAFPSHIGRGEPVEFGIDERLELFRRTGVALGHLVQQLS